MWNELLTHSELEVKEVIELIASYIIGEEARDIFTSSLKTGFSYEEAQERLNFFSEFREILSLNENSLPWPSYLPQKRIISLLEHHQKERSFIFREEELEILIKNIDLSQKLYSISLKGYPEIEKFLSYFSDLSFWWQRIEKIWDFKLHKIKKDATPLLKKLYRKLSEIEESRSRDIKNLLKKFSNSGLLTDDIVVYRGEKFLFPFKVGVKVSDYGIYHGLSKTGQTVYIEPYSVVAWDNKYAEVQVEIEKEIERILSEITDFTLQHREEILSNLNLIYIYDIAYGVGRYGVEYDTERYSLQKLDTDYWILKDARHPLLGKEAIPITIEKDKGKRGIIISGVNAGGKTVTLKTIALFSFLAAVGLPLPLHPDSQLLFYPRIEVLLTGKQGILTHLSGFTSYISRLKKILNDAGENSLILLDELGEGTDPEQGEALAIGVIDYLGKKQVTFIVTTHFFKVKQYSLQHQKLLHYSVRFDQESLTPTFELLKGIIGGSFGLEIAQKFGLPPEVIKRARWLLGKDYRKREKILKEMEESYQIIKNEKELTHSIRVDLQEKLRKEEKRFLSLQKEWIEEFKKIKQDFESFFYEMKNQVREELKKIREGKAGKGLEKEYSRFQNTLSQLEKVGEQELEILEEKVFIEETFSHQKRKGDYPIKEGEWVVIFSGIEGKITAIKDSKIFLLSREGISWQVERKDIEKVIENKEKKEGRTTTEVYTQAIYNVPQEVDLRGMTKEEALLELDKYLSKVLLSPWKRVYIIHGKGEGILRKAVWEHLRENYSHLSFRLGGVGEGGAGVTVIEL